MMAGCGMSDQPQFQLNLQGRDPSSVSPSQQQALAETLTNLFGTPDAPRLPASAPFDLNLIRQAAGPIGGDATGRQEGLYRRYCVGCHGMSGDGAGPSASLLDPYPRDFRNGVFKWKSTIAGAKPTHEDLVRTLQRGVPGTAMPSFLQLSDEEIDALVEYVEYLSIRGETERYLIVLVVDEDEPLSQNEDHLLEEGLDPAAQSWQVIQQDPQRYVIHPPPEPPMATDEQRASSIALGDKLFHNKNAQCVKCHGPDGRGDGTETELYDDWNKPKKGTTPQQTRQLAARFALPIERLRPRNFHEGVFRGGDAPSQVFCRIDAGIAGTPMPAAGPAGGTQGVLTPEQIWHVVHYIQSLANE